MRINSCSLKQDAFITDLCSCSVHIVKVVALTKRKRQSTRKSFGICRLTHSRKDMQAAATDSTRVAVNCACPLSDIVICIHVGNLDMPFENSCIIELTWAINSIDLIFRLSSYTSATPARTIQTCFSYRRWWRECFRNLFQRIMAWVCNHH